MASADDKILERAKKRFAAVVSAEAENRRLMLDDLRFRAGSPDNGWQWPDSVRSQREGAPGGARPCLTSNRIAQHVHQVVNDVRQNRPGIKYLPADEKADVATAEMLNGLVRHIQYISDADTAYDTAADSAIAGGVGYVRVLTDYIDDTSMDQEILIRRVRNPFSVYLDPDAQDPAGADARWAFITEWIGKDEFEAQYPGKEPLSWESAATGDTGPSWYTDDRLRVAEYWERTSTSEDLTIGERSRKVQRDTVTCYTLCGHTILDNAEWAGKFIPVARCVGNEFDIEGRPHYSGLVRNAKDDQRMLNYHYSAEVELIALAPKAPFVGAAGQFEGFEKHWAVANTANLPYLEYNPVVDTDAGPQAFPAPQRQPPPPIASGVQQAKLDAIDGIKATTGQYDASLGARSNETSGRAIMARQHEGDVSTFHYVDNLSKMIRHVGRIIVDLVPKIYDTPRIARILGEDDTHSMAQIQPDMPNAYAESQGPNGEIQKLFNPSIGRYDVLVTTGPSFSTKRQEAADGMQALVQAAPQMMPIVGDILVRALDWPYADQISRRLKAMLPPQAAAADENQDGQQQQIPPQFKAQMDQMAQQHEQLVQALHQAHDQIEEAEKSKDLELQKLQIDHYRAETERMKALEPVMTPQELAAAAAQLVLQALHSPAQSEQQMQELPAVEAAEYPQEPPSVEMAESYSQPGQGEYGN